MIYDEIANILYYEEGLNEIEESYEADASSMWSDDDPLANPYAGTDDPSPADEHTQEDEDEAGDIKDYIIDKFEDIINKESLNDDLNSTQKKTLTNAYRLFLNGDYNRYSEFNHDLSSIFPKDYRAPIQRILDKRLADIRKLENKLNDKNVNQIAHKLDLLKKKAMNTYTKTDYDLDEILEPIMLNDENILVAKQAINRIESHYFNDYHEHPKQAKQLVKEQIKKVNERPATNYYVVSDWSLKAVPLSAKSLLKYLKKDYEDIKGDAQADNHYIMTGDI